MKLTTILALMFASILTASLFLMVNWNLIIPKIFELEELTYIESLGMILFLSIVTYRQNNNKDTEVEDLIKMYAMYIFFGGFVTLLNVIVSLFL